MSTSTITFATLEISKNAYQEIKAKLLKADYGHAVGKLFGGFEMLDMDEIHLVEERKSRPITTREFMYFLFGVFGGGVAVAIGILSLTSGP